MVMHRALGNEVICVLWLVQEAIVDESAYALDRPRGN